MSKERSSREGADSCGDSPTVSCRGVSGNEYSRGQFHGGRRVLVLAAMLLVARPAQAQAQEKAVDLTEVSMENLMNVEVSSVSKKAQKLSRTAAAIFVITQEDIQESGATNIPDLLRMVPGMDVARINGSTWAISARGLNGQFSNELLVLLDGRNVYTPSFGSVFWDTLDLPLENLERIEVIRGPGAAVWGENAVNGVVNIIRKKAGETEGALVVAGGGNSDQEFGTVEYGGKVRKNTDYRVYARYFNKDDMQGSGHEDGGDGWHLLRGGFRTDTRLSGKDSLTVEGDMYAGREGDPVTILTSVTAAEPVNRELFVNLSGGFVQSMWDHTYNETSASTLLLSFDRYERSDLLGDKRKTFNADFHHHFGWGTRQELVWGVGYQRTMEDSEGTFGFSLEPARQATHVASGFVQDEIALVPERLYLTLGTKLEHNTYTGFAALPSVRGVYEFSDRRMMWAGVSRALRTPAETDTSLRLNVAGFTEADGTPTVVSIIGNPRVKDEGLVAFEAGYRTAVGKRLSVDLAGYYNDYDNQISSEPGTPFFENTPAPRHLVVPTSFKNLIYGETHGVEIAATWKVAPRWTLNPSYDFERIHMQSRAPSEDTETAPSTEGDDPHQHARIRSHVELPHRVSWDIAAYFTDRLLAQGIPSYTRVDTRLSWRWKEGVTFSVAGQDLLRTAHREFVDSDGATNATLARRSWYGKVTWAF